jgi:hypothetical protein
MVIDLWDNRLLGFISFNFLIGCPSVILSENTYQIFDKITDEIFIIFYISLEFPWEIIDRKNFISIFVDNNWWKYFVANYIEKYQWNIFHHCFHRFLPIFYSNIIVIITNIFLVSPLIWSLSSSYYHYKYQ